MMGTHDADTYRRAAEFFDGAPTGQYDDEAAHALRCHHELLKTLEVIRPYLNAGEALIADAAIAKATDYPA